MEIKLLQEELRCYTPVFTACVSQECTADSVVPDRLPDVQRVLDAEAAVFLRRRNVGPGEITLEGEIRAVILFQGEGEEEIRKQDYELPCSFSIPAEGAREGDRVRARLVVNRAEGRIVNPRKLGLSVELRALVELYRDACVSVTTGVDSDELETQLREETLSYAAELGEKSFTVMEECSLPVGRPAIREILHAGADAVVTDRKTVGGKCILQGNARWELRYLDNEGNPAQERFNLPFSQLLDIPEEADGGQDVWLTAESAYAEILPSPGGADSVSLELHLLAQTLSWAQKTMTVLSDLYSVRHACETESSELRLSAPGERLLLHGTADAPLEMPERVSAVLMSYVHPTIPEVAEGVVTLPVRLHALCRTEDGALCALKRSVTVRFSGGTDPEDLQLGEAVCGEPGLTIVGDRLELRLTAELPAQRMAETAIPYITGAELSPESAGEENAPSLVVLRPDGQSLWELAKRYRSTIALIQACNGEDARELLLIPRAR